MVERQKQITALLHTWLEDRLQAEARAWLVAKEAAVAAGKKALLYTAFSGAPRFVGKADLALGAEALKAARAVRPGWDPRAWSVDQAVRTLLLLSYPSADPAAYVQTLELLYETADVAEAVALYQMLPLLPHGEDFLSRGTEGLRTNMTTVFNAVALRNPYPADYFGENAFNQMVLKAVFIGSPLHEIVGLDQRANRTLARMLSDYAHERWAASRTVTPELWRPVGPFATGAILADVERVFREADPLLQRAGALALASSPAPEATALLAERPDLQADLEKKRLTWDTFAASLVA